MGDTGAMFLGFVLGAISVEGRAQGGDGPHVCRPILALGLPIFDTLFAIARRFANGKPVYKADCDHLHHRLLALGLSQRQSVLILYAFERADGRRERSWPLAGATSPASASSRSSWSGRPCLPAVSAACGVLRRLLGGSGTADE